MNAFIYDIRFLKYRFVQAYFHLQLLEAQRMTDEGKGKECATNTDMIGDVIGKIVQKIEDNKNTYEDITNIVKFNPPMREYYNIIGATVKKHFKEGQGWIPSFLTIEVLRLFDEKGYMDFKEIDFLKLQEYYQKHKSRKESNLPLHYKCAEDIYNSIMAKKIFRKKKRK